MGKSGQQVLRKLEEWQAAGLISPEQASAIRAREAAEKPGRPWGILIFAGFGAVVLGLGVILLFAYNWDQMPRFAKLGIVFGAMAAAHGTGLYLRRKEALQGFAESAQVLGTMLFGAGIWLVAQIYHISAHYPNGFIVWAAGALLLAWALPSVAQGLVAAVLLSVWACSEVFSYDDHIVAAPLLVLFGTGLLAWRLRSPVLLAAAAINFAVTSVAGFSFNGDSAFIVPLGTAVLYGSLAWLVRGSLAFPSAHTILRVTGWFLYFPLLFFLTFHDGADDLLGCHYRYWNMLETWGWLPVAFVPVLALVLAGLAMRRAVVMRQCGSAEFRSRLAAPAIMLLVFLMCWWLLRFSPWPFAWDVASALAGAVSVIANGVFLYHTVDCLWNGCRETRLGWVVGGSLLLAAWVFARFADLFDSLLARGVMFVVMGGALFGVGIFYHLQKRKPCAPSAGEEI